jgi:hypothetical protein
MTRFQYDFSLLSVLLDHWRPETHTFHFTIGEMTVTLRDTSLLMGLPCEGESLRAEDVEHTPRVLMQGRKNSRRRTPGRIPLYSY